MIKLNDFEKHFEKLAKTDDASTLWINWLDWVIDQNLIINHDRKLNFRGNEKMYFQLYQDWIKIVSDELEKGDTYHPQSAQLAEDRTDPRIYVRLSEGELPSGSSHPGGLLHDGCC